MNVTQSVFTTIGIVIVSLLGCQFLQVEMLRYMLRATGMRRPRTGRLHLSVFSVNFGMLGWLALTLGSQLMVVVGSSPASFGPMRGFQAGLMTYLASGSLSSLFLLCAYVAFLAVALQQMVYGGDVAEASPEKSAALTGQTRMNWPQSLLVAFTSSGLTFLIVGVGVAALVMVFSLV